jgi:hypothetical protein
MLEEESDHCRGLSEVVYCVLYGVSSKWVSL